ncbi:hypothetical protein ACPOL_2623 [Acidisarcina polymorpha]|uniref:Uncharacterized protein n=1 Tax=Acidisarcina polymorpha TaxID=2211140 RepID=A0A2Z5FYI9_9BACT|nr:hypothetical protein ACPOL_2623 [Acidisarcina polymorpha]
MRNGSENEFVTRSLSKEVPAPGLGLFDEAKVASALPAGASPE